MTREYIGRITLDELLQITDFDSVRINWLAPFAEGRDVSIEIDYGVVTSEYTLGLRHDETIRFSEWLVEAANR